MESRERLNELAERVAASGQIQAEDLPDLDLYMDQVLTLLEGKLGETRRSDKEKLLTGTMVGNYTKEGLLKKIKGKKYPKEHLLMMVMLYHLKRSLALGDIKSLFGLVEEKLTLDRNHYDPTAVEQIFHSFGEMQRVQAEQFTTLFAQGVGAFQLGDTQPEELLRTILWLCNLSDLASATAQRLIDAGLQGEERGDILS